MGGEGGAASDGATSGGAAAGGAAAGGAAAAAHEAELREIDDEAESLEAQLEVKSARTNPDPNPDPTPDPIPMLNLNQVRPWVHLFKEHDSVS